MTAGDSSASARRAAAQIDWLVACWERCVELVEGVDPDAASDPRSGVDRGNSLRQLDAMTPPPDDSDEIRSMAGEPEYSESPDSEQHGSHQRGDQADSSRRGQVFPRDRDTP
jgi:hypothetical protein